MRTSEIPVQVNGKVKAKITGENTDARTLEKVALESAAGAPAAQNCREGRHGAGQTGKHRGQVNGSGNRD